MASIQREVAMAFLDSFKDIDGEANLALRTPDCRHVMAPGSLGLRPDMTNEQWLAHVSSVKEVLSALPVTAKEIFEHEGSNQVTIWATSEATFREEAKDAEHEDWSYHGEYMFVLFFNQAGDKIERIVEFLDSKAAAEVFGRMARARQNVAARKGGAS